MKQHTKKVLAIMLAFTLLAPSVFDGNVVGTKAADTQQEGSLADKVTGTWSYWDGSKDVVQTNAMLLDKLPTKANQGITRWTTEHYDESTGAFDMGEWGTSLMWSYTADKWGNTTYAIPMSYKATAQGWYVTKPSTIRVETAFLMEQPEDGSLTDFIIGPAFTAGSKKVDRVTDWSYDVVMEDRSNPAVTVKTTLVQGSPFSFYQANGTQQLKILRKRPLPSAITYYNGTTVENSTMLVFRVFDNQDDSLGYSNYDYYAAYVPKDTTWVQSAGTGYAEDKIGTLTANFPSGENSYMSFAWLCESTGPSDAQAEKIAKEYEKYAYNFITDTKASYSYNQAAATVTTTYEYTLNRKAESTADGTIMGILPHQYKNMSGYTYLENTARTLRGTMKFIAGSSYETKLKYTGILPSMMPIDEADFSTLQGYVDDFMDEFGPTDTAVTKEKYDVNTYDTGKKLNRAMQVMAAAESCGDTENAGKLLDGIKAELSDWFTWSGETDEKYFYYDEAIGSLFGFPQSYYTVDGMTDHHFHYGYFINAAAQVALRDPSFAEKYGNTIDELIGDIASPEENTPDSRYPQLRYFSQYEGHSWASGHANFADGNNQESSSEALNAWAGLILYGQATHDQALTEEGIYLYTTEVSAVNNYWFDIDDDVLDKSFKAKNHILASMVWSGKYGYEAWWTAEPLQVQGINILPMTAASFYASADKDYILKNFEMAQANEAAFTGEDKDTNRWNEIWSVYLAMADPQKALDYFNPDCSPEAGDSKAHAFHTIMALDQFGTPDLSVTSDMPLSAVFTNKDGEKTYVVYNADKEDYKAAFSDGTTVDAKAGGMSTVSEVETAGRAVYTVEHYLQTEDGYILNDKETKSGKVGSEVTATAKPYTGYELDETIEGTKKSGEVTEDGNLVLKLYYKQSEIQEVPPGADDSLYQKLGSYNGIDIYYYLIRDDLGANIKLLDANTTFYIEYSSQYTSANTKGYMNHEETPNNVLTGVYKFSTSILQPDSYTTIKIKSGSKLLTMIIRYGNPAGGPTLDDDEIEVPTQPETMPTDVVSLELGNAIENTVIVTFRETAKQKEKGQTYNIYVNGTAVKNDVAAGTYYIENIAAGTCTVKVTATLSGRESEGVEKTIKVTGKKYEEPMPTQPETPQTTAPETTKSQPATPQQTVPETTKSQPATPQQTTPETTESQPATPQQTTPEKPTILQPTSSETTDLEFTTSQQTAPETTKAQIPTQKPTTENPATEKSTTAGNTAQNSTNAQTTAAKLKTVKLKKAGVKKAVKKKTAKKVRLLLKKIKGIKKYQIQISKSKKFKKKNLLVTKTVKRIKCTIKSKKLRNRKKLYVRARAMKKADGRTCYGKWSKKKKIRVNK